MEFGQWLQKKRLKNEMDLRTFAERVGVDMSTISRIENVRTRPTLATVIRICEALDVTPAHLLEGLQAIHHVYLEFPSAAPHGEFPTLEDIQAFVGYMSRDWCKGGLLLAGMMNTIAALQMQGRKTNQREGANFFDMHVVDQLLLDAPFYHVELRYPQEITTDEILAIYRAGAWLMAIDAGTYIRSVRRQKQVSLTRLQHAVKTSDAVLARLEEGALEHVKFVDVFMLDEQLGQGGQILALYWRVYQLREALMQFLSQSNLQQKEMPLPTWISQEMRLILMFTILCRWFQRAYQKERDWMNELREQFQ
jgi:transcriptional regulator with XRE-family HTH domain